MFRLILIAFALAAARGDVNQCACDPARPETMQARECGLCREAEQQPPHVEIFFLKDINPRKPNRWLALPRKHLDGGHHLHEMTPKERTALWTAAIGKARELWGEQWGIAYNSEKVRTQCHTHLHIGKLLKGVERDVGIFVDSPARIPAPPGKGIWVHPVGKRLHVHIEDTITETALMR